MKLSLFSTLRGYRKEYLLKDIFSGIIIAAVSIPISMGYAQISGKYNTSPKDKLMMDMIYIEEFSILRDIQLIFQTAIVLLKSDSTEAFRTNETRKYIFKEAQETKTEEQ